MTRRVYPFVEKYKDRIYCLLEATLYPQDL